MELNRKINIDLKTNFSSEIIIKKSEVGFTSHCPFLDVWSQGDTEKEAEKNICEAVYLFLDVCIEKGTLEKVLKDCQDNYKGEISASKGKILELEIPIRELEISGPNK